MEEHVYYNSLFDCYKDLLTAKECEYFESYYSEDLSLSEIALNTNVSRAAVHKAVKNVIEKLEDYEHSLHLYEINKGLKECLSTNDINVIHEKVEKLLNK